MKVLGIFTGRSGSTSEWMTKAALSGAAEQGDEIEAINLRDLNIKPCSGCNACVMSLTTGRGPVCTIKDDLAFVTEKIRSADGLIVLSPMYEKTPPSEFKAMCDRMGPGHDVAMLGLNNMLAKKNGTLEKLAPDSAFHTRPVAFISHGGSEWTTLGLPVMSLFSISQGMKICNLLDIQWDILSILNDEVIEKLKAVGRSVAENCGKAEEDIVYCGPKGLCPMCHNRTFLADETGNGVTCSVCGIHGTLGLDDNGNIRVDFSPEELAHSHVTMSGKQIHAQDLGSFAGKIMAANQNEIKRRQQELLAVVKNSKPQ